MSIFGLYFSLKEHIQSGIRPYLTIGVLFVIARTSFWLLHGHVTLFPDSEGYVELAERIANLDLTGYDARRTLGYPSLIAIAFKNLQMVVVIQQLLGLASIFFLFDMLRSREVPVLTCIGTSIISCSLFHVLFYETVILTESFSLFLLTMTFWYIDKKNVLTQHANATPHIILSLMLALLYLTRPFFIYITLTVAFYILANKRLFALKGRASTSLTIALPTILAFLLWGTFNKKNTGYFGSTSFLGYNLSQTTVGFIDKASDEHRVIRDLYVKKRDSIKLYGKEHQYPMSIWFAYDELLAATNYEHAELGHQLKQLSISLIKDHPVDYLKQVAISWKDFWKYSIHWDPNGFNNDLVKKAAIGAVLYVERPLLLMINLVFLTLCALWSIRIFRKEESLYGLTSLVAVAILLGSLLQAMVVYGGNSRFRFPYLLLIIYFTVSNLHLIKISRGKTHPST